jgi:hypothetical protein
MDEQPTVARVHLVSGLYFDVDLTEQESHDLVMRMATDEARSAGVTRTMELPLHDGGGRVVTIALRYVAALEA